MKEAPHRLSATVTLGFAVVVNPQVAFVGAAAFLGFVALAAPASAWVLAALIATLTFGGLVELGLLPAVATYMDLPLAWGALAVALIRRDVQTHFLRRHLRWLAALAASVFLAWAFHPSEVLRPFLYLALLGAPFAVVGALLAEPPAPAMRKTILAVLLGLLVAQIPIALWQVSAVGQGDFVQGTLYGAGAGAHVISGVAAVGALWLLSGGRREEMADPLRIGIALLLLAIPFMADAKQVIIAMPAVVFIVGWRGGFAAAATRTALVLALVVGLFVLLPAGKAAEQFLEQNEGGQGGKQDTLALVWNKITDEPASVLFGRGPAETVSRAAYQTIPQGPGGESPLRVIGLEPAEITREAANAARQAGSGETSLQSGVSSFIGVLGDLGLVGLTVYGILLVSLVLRLRGESSPEAIAAAGGLALFVVLGIAFDWWEQPPFGIVVAVLGGIALVAGSERDRAMSLEKG